MEFSEELKQIVRETKGVWPARCGRKIDMDGIIGWHEIHENTEGGFTRQQYEACLMEITGRPKVEDWPEGKDFAFHLNTESWIFADAMGFLPREYIFSPAEIVLRSDKWMHKNEALEREHIINGASSSEVELQYLGEANKDPLSVEFNVVEDDNWFRNGDLPPIGEIVFAVKNERGEGLGCAMSVVGVFERDRKRIWCVEGDCFATCLYSDIWPLDFSIVAIENEAYEINEFKNQVLLIENLVSNDKDSYPLALYLYKNGCRIHPELAE